MLTFRFAEVSDTPLILNFVQELAEYEKMSDDVIATEELFNKWIFKEKKAEVFFGMVNGKEIGFVLFFHNFSTFVGKAGIYLEDLFIKPEYRGNGYGKALLRHLASIAVERECGRIEWSCLNWNKPSIEFYSSLGAKPMDEWTTYRMDRETFTKFVDEKEKNSLH